MTAKVLERAEGWEVLRWQKEKWRGQAFVLGVGFVPLLGCQQ